MSMASIENNNGFTEKLVGEKQVLVTNNLGRDVEQFELVYLGYWFGEVVSPDGIANGETGYINIDHERIIQTAQINTAATFTVGSTLYFKSGGSSAEGTLESSAGGATAIGTITGEGGTGGAQTYVEFRPFIQKANNDGLDTRIDALEVDATTAQATIVVPLGTITQENGTPLTVLNSTTSGFTQLANAEQVISLPIDATIEALGFCVSIPQDLDDTEDITIHVLAGKSANNDELTLDCEVYPCAVGDTGNADIQDTAATAITQAASELVFTCGDDGVIAAPGTLTVILTLGGTNDGDAVYIYGAWIEYTKKIMTA
jgi:hypothetical protein